MPHNLTRSPLYHRPMARKSNPARIYDARRAAIESRLTRTKVLSPEEAERWLAAWEVQAAAEGQDRDEREFWDRGLEWITETRRVRRGRAPAASPADRAASGS